MNRLSASSFTECDILDFESFQRRPCDRCRLCNLRSADRRLRRTDRAVYLLEQTEGQPVGDDAEYGTDSKLKLQENVFRAVQLCRSVRFVGLAIPLYNYIDTNTFNKAMIEAGHQAISQDMLAILTLYVQKLVMIPVSLATAFGLTLIPTITESFTSGNYKLLNQQINQTMQTILFLIIPAVVGISLLAGPTYTFFTDQRAFILSWVQTFCFGIRQLRFCSLYLRSTQPFCRVSINKNLRLSAL